MELCVFSDNEGRMRQRAHKPNPSKGRNYVRDWRLYRGLTQEQLAGQADYTPATISQLETGKQGYEEKTLIRLAEVLDCHPSDLISGPPEAGNLMAELRALPDATRTEIIDALNEMLSKLKRISNIDA